MVPEYHFWKPASGEGRDAWDVARLITLAAELPIEHVAIDDVDEIDSSTGSTG